MPSSERSPVFLRILLACILIAVLGLLPYPSQVHQAFETANRATAAKQPAAAVERLRQLVAFEPWRTGLWEQIGRSELEAGNLGGSIQAYRMAQSHGSLSVDGQLALGEASLQAGDAAGAIQVWQALAGRPAAPLKVYQDLSDLLRARYDLNGSLGVLKEWGKREPENSQVLYQQGLLMLAMQPDQGLPGELLQAGKLDSALSARVEILRKATGLALSSDNQAYHRLVVGRAFGSLDEWNLAGYEFDQATKLSPDYAEAWAFLGEAKQHLEQDGYPDLQKASRLNPDSVLTQALLSVYWRRQGQPKQALEYLNRMISAEPGQAIWQVEAGNTMIASGNLIEAMPFFQKAVSLEPGNPSNWQALAAFSIDYNMDLLNIGLPAARQALKLAPTNPAVLDLMGQAFLKLNDLTSAERFLQRAIEADRTFAAAHLHLGQVYMQWDRPEPAYQQLQAAERLDGKGPVGAMAKRLLAQFFPGG